MSVIADNPDVCLVPSTARFSVIANCGDSFIDDLIGLLHVRTCVTLGMRGFIDTSERSEDERWMSGSNSFDDFRGNLAIDLQPALNATCEMSPRSFHDKCRTSSKNVFRI